MLYIYKYTWRFEHSLNSACLPHSQKKKGGEVKKLHCIARYTYAQGKRVMIRSEACASTEYFARGEKVESFFFFGCVFIYLIKYFILSLVRR